MGQDRPGRVPRLEARAGPPTLERILRIYVAHSYAQRPHRGRDLRTPDPRSYQADEPPDRLRVRGGMC